MMKNDPKPRHRMLIRFTDEEYSLVKENVAKSRLFIQNYFRMLIRGIRPTEKPGNDYFELNHNLLKIGSNLFQIAVKAIGLKMSEGDVMWDVAREFNNHCTKILHMMLRCDKPYRSK